MNEFMQVVSHPHMQSHDQHRPMHSRSARRGRIVIALPGLGAGGTEHVVNILANHWAGLGYDVTIVTLEPPTAAPYYTFDPKVKIVNLDIPPQRVSAPYAAWLTIGRVIALRRMLKNAKPDVIFSFQMRTNVIALIAIMGSRTPVIVSERNNPALQPYAVIWNRLRSVLYPRAFGLVTMTQGAMNHFPPFMRQRSWVIPNPVDLPNGRRQVGNGKRLAAVGRLVPQKGFDLLIDAFANIADRHPDWTLVIWGEGSDRHALEEQVRRRGLQQRIFMPGLSDSPGSWLKTADAFVLSSRFEGWGVVLLEAMAWGLPCVSFDCEWGPRDMIEDGVDGIIVQRENVNDLAQKLSDVMGSPKLRRKLSKAAKISTRRFSHARVMVAWDDVIQAALAGHGVNSARP